MTAIAARSHILAMAFLGYAGEVRIGVFQLAFGCGGYPFQGRHGRRAAKTSLPRLRAARARSITIAATLLGNEPLLFVVDPSKARCAGLNGLFGLPDCDAKGNEVVGVNDRKLFGILTALEIERFVFGAVDVNDLTWF